MSGKPVTIGPFIGGLNNVSKAGESEDSEVVDLINFEVTTDKTLTSRPPIQIATGSNLAGATVPWEVLGIYRLSSSNWYVIAQKPSGADYIVGHMLSGDPATFTAIKTATGVLNKATAMVQVDDKIYFSVGVGSSINGYYWKFGDVSVTDTPTMPKGYTMVVFKSRIWLAGQDAAATGSTLWFTTIDSTGIIKYDTWTVATDFIKVAPGEGGNITCLLALNNSIVIFKNDGTWRFSYASAPKDGQVDRISGSIGAAGPQCAAEFENYVYVYDQGKLYELVNNIFTQINRTLNFEVDTSGVDISSTYGATLSIVNRRLVVRYFNALYSYNLDTRAWSQWRSFMGTPGKFWEMPTDSNSADSSTYIAASQGLTQNLSGNVLDSTTFNQEYLQSGAGPSWSVSVVGSTISVVKLSGTANLNILLNSFGTGSNYNLPFGGGYKFSVSATLLSGVGTFRAVANFLLKDGTTTSLSSGFFVAGANSYTFTAPVNALQCYVYFFNGNPAVGYTETISNISISRTTDAAPVNLLTIKDKYESSASSVEYIECVVRTKSYDYQAPTVRKRLFWWAIDAKTNQGVVTRTIPITKAAPITWGDLSAYTHAELSFGTWGAPLGFLNPTLIIHDEHDVSNSATENGRVTIKNDKGLRFRQISFEVKMKTFGEANTGPAKLFTLTSYVLPKEKVSESVS